jgi:twinkle protein
MALPDYTQFDNELLSLAARFGASGSQFRTICPSCSPTRSKPNQSDKCLSVLDEDGRLTYNCWHCGVHGVVTTPEARERELRVAQPRPRAPGRARPSILDDERLKKSGDDGGPSIRGQISDVGTSSVGSQSTSLRPIHIGGRMDNEVREWLHSRGITDPTIDRLGLFSALRWFRKVGKEALAVGFRYFDRNGQVRAAKFRCIQIKDFTMDVVPSVNNEEDVGGSNIFWRIDTLKPEEDLIITEGEIDACSAYEAGITNVTSIPSGAGKGEMKYVWNAEKFINECKKIILALDDDEAGIECAEELSRRIGRGKCWVARYPAGCKDLNEVLLKHGPEAVRKSIEKAEPWPVKGLFRSRDFWARVKDLWANGQPEAACVGIPSLDELITIYPGHVSIVTGIPGHGKSEMVDMMLYRLAKREDWKFALCSFENDPELHIPKLAEKYTGRPFFEGLNPRMTEGQRDEALAWIDDHFVFIQQADGEPGTIQSILDRAVSAVQQYGIKGLVIDPYNYVDRQDADRTETDFISDMLTQVRNFARGYGVHVWFVAHPQKMRALEDGTQRVPGGYDISGSAAWFAKADLGYTIHRYNDRPDYAEVHVWKVRFKWLGKTGQVGLKYNPLSGRYSEDFDWDKASKDIGVPDHGRKDLWG